MGAAREAFSLFNKHQRRSLFRHIRTGRWKFVRIYVYRDTFTPILCWLSGGHEFYWKPDPVDEPEELFCSWCHCRQPKDEQDECN